LLQALDELEALYGKPPRPVPRNPFEWILWENVAYLVDDRRRERAFRALEERVGLTPERIRRAAQKTLAGVAELGGMHPRERAERLREIADLAAEHGDLAGLLELSPPQARKVLKKFPGIGDPGADKILLFASKLPVLDLESNGLRVLVRLGYGEEKKSYSATYRSVQEALEPELPDDCAWLMGAHSLLRTHGQALCKRTGPDCDACPLLGRCAYGKVAGG
jgi:endonuclease III